MMYRCENCGHLFEEGEQAVWEERHGLDTPPYEKLDGCPLCRGGYEEVHQCKECEEWHTEDELYEGWCEKCLRETINYDTFFEYCEANKDENYLDLFVMTEFFDVEMPKYSSYDFHNLMIRVYCERVNSIKVDKKLFGKSSDEFLDACIRFIMDDDGESGRENYADWLNSKKEVK
jgi:hypothetical protein